MERLQFTAVVPTEKIQCIRIRIKHECIADYHHKSIKRFPHIGPAGDQEDLVHTGKIA